MLKCLIFSLPILFATAAFAEDKVPVKEGYEKLEMGEYNKAMNAPTQSKNELHSHDKLCERIGSDLYASRCWISKIACFEKKATATSPQQGGGVQLNFNNSGK